MPNCLIHNDKQVSTKLLEEHHKHPTAYGGPDIPENICWLCPSCHDAVHRMSHLYYARKNGEADDLITQYLPNQPARQQRLKQLCLTVANARREHVRTGDAPAAGEDEQETVKMTVEVPSWVHHRLKTATMGKGLYKSITAYLTKLAVDLTKSSGGEESPVTIAEEEATTEEPDAQPAALPLIDLGLYHPK